jgi:hypothetical protein
MADFEKNSAALIFVDLNKVRKNSSAKINYARINSALINSFRVNHREEMPVCIS